MIYFWVIVVILVSGLVLFLFRREKANAIQKGCTFEEVKRMLWELRERTLVGSTLLVEGGPENFIIGFLKEEGKVRGSVAMTLPDTALNRHFFKAIQEAFTESEIRFEKGDDRDVTRYMMISSGADFARLCDIAKIALEAVGCSGSDTFTVRGTNYDIDPRIQFNSEAYCDAMRTVESIKLS